MRRGFFVTGTDTGVGKTVVSAILSTGLGASYWKPVQTGVGPGREESDSTFVSQWDIPVHPEAYIFPDPLSPHAAAQIAGQEISLTKILAIRPAASPLVVEGAGGVMVPLNSRDFILDLIECMEIPVILVTRSTLGTINHTLLSLNALRGRGIPVAGVVICGPPDSTNRAAIANYGDVEILGEVSPCRQFSRAWMQAEFNRFSFSKNIMLRNQLSSPFGDLQ
ncbi:MAG: dethiobiotin synthase [Bdellovibrionales bacterium]